MKALFLIISFIPKNIFCYLIDVYLAIGIYKHTKAYKITKINLEICFPSYSKNEILLLSKLSLREMFVSGYETIFCWARNDYVRNSEILVVKNNFLLQSYIKNNKSLIAMTFHNRSVDMLLLWLNSQTSTTSLYKKIKFKPLDSFVKKVREENNCKSFETSISGVRQLIKSLNDNKVVCFAADQVPKRGMGEYINFFNKEAYSTTLIQKLSKKTSSDILACYVSSSKNNELKINIELFFDNVKDSEYLHSVNYFIEDIVSKKPIDYSWEYKKFKKSKPGILSPYKDI